MYGHTCSKSIDQSGILSASKPSSEKLRSIRSITPVVQWSRVLAVGFPTSVMGSLWSRQSRLWERWFCARGWWDAGGAHRLIAGDTRNLVLVLSLVPHIMGILWYHTLINTQPTIQPYNHMRPTIQLNPQVYERTNPGITKHIPCEINFLIYTACCCSANKPAFRAFKNNCVSP